MGTNIRYSTCSACGNRAEYAHDYCDCIKNKKGSISIVSQNQVRDLLDAGALRPEWLPHLMPSKIERQDVLLGLSNRRKVAVRNVELNHKLSFFELSVVAQPAFGRAVELEKYAHKMWKLSGSSVWRPVGNTAIDNLWKNLSDDDLLKFTSEAQERGLISTACAIS